MDQGGRSLITHFYLSRELIAPEISDGGPALTDEDEEMVAAAVDELNKIFATSTDAEIIQLLDQLASEAQDMTDVAFFGAGPVEDFIHQWARTAQAIDPLASARDKNEKLRIATLEMAWITPSSPVERGTTATSPMTSANTDR